MDRWLILDVDGVLSPYSRSLPTAWQPWAQPATRSAVWLSRSMGAAIKQLMDRHALRGAWLTTWCRESMATQIIAPTIGLGGDWPEIPWEHLAKPRANSTHASKATGLAAWLDGLAEPPAAVIWIDDQLGPLGDLDFALRPEVTNPLDDRNIPSLLVAPDMWTGLTRQQLADIDHWLDR